jgi:hypothetical protein
MDRGPRVVLTVRLVVAAWIYFAAKTALTYTSYVILLEIFLEEWPENATVIRGVLRAVAVVAFLVYAVKPLVDLLVFRQDSD